ncbi:MAG: hypothetical protein H5T86_14360, partial [Armatimonadetes bacterium]|nr:hypothetical protein [Armatimonadota bacterium]
MEADSRGIYLHTARKCVSVAIGAVFLLAVAVAALRVCNSPASFNRRNVATTAEEFLANRPWLGQKLEHWQVRIAGTAKLPSYSDLAAFPVGNGTCFAIVGLHWPLATLSNIIGPGYQKRFGFLGTLIPWVRVAGRQVELPEQSVAWSAGGPAVVTSARHPQRIELDTFVCAPPDFRVIVVAASVANLSKAVQRNVELALTSSMPGPQHTRDGMLFERGTVRLRIGMLGAKGRVREGLAPEFPPSLDKRVRPLQPGAGHTVLYSLGTLRPGESVAKLIYLIFAENEQEETQALDALQKLQFSIFDGVAAAWKDWQGKVVEVGTAWPRLNEWLQAQEYILLAQRSSCGAFSPMHGYTYAWVRDSNGPLRFFSLAGATDLVRDHLEYHFRACASKGQVGNNVPLDLALPKSVVQPDWTKVPVEPAEVPSFAVLQHYWYYRVTGDLTLVRWHEGMLKR